MLGDPEIGGGYDQDIFDNLIFRYEEPNGMARWDSPLFTVPYDDETPPFDAIWEAMVGSEGKAKVVKPNQATVLVRISPLPPLPSYSTAPNLPPPSRKAPATSSDYLYELDKSTQEILSTILEWQKYHPGEGGGEVAVADLRIELPASPVSLPQLQRVRRQFIALNRQHKLPQNRIREAFVEYVNDSFK